MPWLENYEPVEDRLREFWERYPVGRVFTDEVHHGEAPGEVIVFRADLYRGDELRDTPPAATGWAHQRILERPPLKRDGSPNPAAPEWTSPYETAETSAIGRALANLGFAPKGGRPSREEVSKAEATASAYVPDASAASPEHEAVQGEPEPGPVGAPAPGAAGGFEPATAEQWARAQALGITKTRVLKEARRLDPDHAPTKAVDVSGEQMAKVIEAALSREGE